MCHYLEILENKGRSLSNLGSSAINGKKRLTCFGTISIALRRSKNLSIHLRRVWVFMSDRERPPHREDYEIAVICVLHEENNAFEALFGKDWEEHEKYPKASSDSNSYSMGRIGQADVVLAFQRSMGKENAASAAANLRYSFPGIKLGLVVGICGGVPTYLRQPKSSDLFLGDVVISTGEVPYDLGSQYPHKFVRKSSNEYNLVRAGS